MKSYEIEDEISVWERSFSVCVYSDVYNMSFLKNKEKYGKPQISFF